MALPERLKFGVFLGPFHRPGENPTLALERDLELVQWLDTLGFDEAWIGEHHSAGWETISSPEIFMAVAAERTRNIKLGTGVISLPYHHPLMVANRMVLLDHLTRGRVMMGVGPGALVTDAYMLGIDTAVQRERMDEALGVILRLFTETEPVNHKSDWFELHEAMLQLKPYQRPHMPIAVASLQSPSGVALAGKHGTSVLTLNVPRDTATTTSLKSLWAIAEESAAEHGHTVKREEWRLVVPMHLAETREEAINDIRLVSGSYEREYFEQTLGRPSAYDGPMEQIVNGRVEDGTWVVGTPEDCIEGIQRLDERAGGFGGLLVQVVDWAPREKLLHSYELLARYVMPHFQGSLAGVKASNQWAREHTPDIEAMRTRAMERAQQVWAERK